MNTRLFNRNSRLFPAVALAFTLAAFAAYAEEASVDVLNPLLPTPVLDQFSIANHPYGGAAAFFDDASLTLMSTYFGRVKYCNNEGRPGATPTTGELHVNAFGERIEFSSGYAWNWLGIDLSGQTNLGKARGISEILLHKEPENEDRSSISLAQAALKTRFGDEQFGFEARGGFTPIFVGSIGTLDGMYYHSYRGLEAKFFFKGIQIGYGLADRFRNEFDNTYRRMTNSWQQGRYGDKAERISYIHSLGLRYEFGENKEGFVDLGVGEGKNYRRNMQGMLSVPVDLGDVGKLTLGLYGIAGRFKNGGLFDNGGKPLNTEYHVSASATLDRGDWSYMVGMGHSYAPDDKEMSFRLAAWGNSDHRNFIQTTGQMDDHVWDGQNVVKTQIRYAIGEKIRLPGLSVGVRGFYMWNMVNPGKEYKSSGWEVDYNVKYEVQKGHLKGLAVGFYAGHLRYDKNRFHGRQSRNDYRVIMTYSKTFEDIFRRMRKN